MGPGMKRGVAGHPLCPRNRRHLGNPSLVMWFAMGETWDLDPDGFLLWVFFLDLF